MQMNAKPVPAAPGSVSTRTRQTSISLAPPPLTPQPGGSGDGVALPPLTVTSRRADSDGTTRAAGLPRPHHGKTLHCSPQGSDRDLSRQAGGRDGTGRAVLREPGSRPGSASFTQPGSQPAPGVIEHFPGTGLGPPPPLSELPGSPRPLHPPSHNPSPRTEPGHALPPAAGGRHPAALGSSPPSRAPLRAFAPAPLPSPSRTSAPWRLAGQDRRPPPARGTCPALRGAARPAARLPRRSAGRRRCGARLRPSARPPPARGGGGGLRPGRRRCCRPPAGEGGAVGGRRRRSGLCNRARSHRAPAAGLGGPRGARSPGGAGAARPR